MSDSRLHEPFVGTFKRAQLWLKILLLGVIIHRQSTNKSCRCYKCQVLMMISKGQYDKMIVLLLEVQHASLVLTTLFSSPSIKP